MPSAAEREKKMESIVELLDNQQREHLARTVLALAQTYIKDSGISAVLIMREGPVVRVMALNTDEADAYYDCKLASEMLENQLQPPTEGEIH